MLGLINGYKDNIDNLSLMCKAGYENFEGLADIEEILIPQRYSDVSTSESVDSEDGLLAKESFWSEGHFEEWHFDLLTKNGPIIVDSRFFTPMSGKSEQQYKILNEKVHKLLEVLDDTMDSVNIRDECSLKPAVIKLDGPKFSLLQKRRTLLLPPKSEI
ncbi:unnamed protein product [Blepharisma stoltei]|uniref:Uncharacterized protein n=1 Tax=Blepharisma stoltei TaxID=1481888 RepID=A0AAU9IPV5_9CILI|nr:unnamed protein product [Blepharisma stoltei]